MHAADEALYVAKRSGRDTWRLASDPSEPGGPPDASRPRRRDTGTREVTRGAAGREIGGETVAAVEDLG
jgi:hypothetical protein